MKPPSGPKKQTQTNPIQTQSKPVLSVVEWANFFKGQNRSPKNPATPARQLRNMIGQYYKIRVKHYFLAGLWMQAD